MLKVLIIEDEETIRKGLIYTFEWQKHGCVIAGEAKNGEEGIKVINEIKPDIVITDVTMPIKDGLQMIEETKHLDYKAIILSGYDEFEYAKKAISLEVCEYLLKPLDHDQLDLALQKIIKDITPDEQEFEIPEVKINTFNSVKANNHINQILEYIHENYSEKILMKDLQKLTGMGSTYINNHFKKFTNHTFNDYLNRIRIQKATELIIKTDMKIYIIAQKVGFSDYKYFVNMFKRYIGYTPTEFVDNTLRNQKLD